MGFLGVFLIFAGSRQLSVLEKNFFWRKIALPKKPRRKNFNSETQTKALNIQNHKLGRKTLRILKLVENNPENLNPTNTIPNKSAERLSSAMNALGAECAARGTIRDKRVHSL